MKIPSSLTIYSGCTNSHLQGIAIDKKREYLYLSFTTSLLKVDLQGNLVGSVDGLVGHLGCIAYHEPDGNVYGSLEFKHDSIGTNILRRSGQDLEMTDGFYAVRFHVDRIDRLHMDAERDGVMDAVFLQEVFDDYSAPGHRYGCSGIDGMTFAPAMGTTDGPLKLYVAYGIYGDTERTDNDHQVILCYDISRWDSWAKPLNQRAMHRSGPTKPEAKYFAFTGNTTYGIQNLEYVPEYQTMFAAVYVGKKPQYPNYPMYFIDCGHAGALAPLEGVGQPGLTLPLKDFGSGVSGCRFPFGSTGMISLGDGLFYMAEPIRRGEEYGGILRLYRFDTDTLSFSECKEC